MADRDAALQALLDKQEITELLTRYLRSVDRGDVATLRSCYLPGATEEHGGLFAGPARDYVDSITAALTHPRARTSHNMTNLLIKLDGDVATAESYCVTFARIKADGEYYHSFTGARMIDRLERRDGDPGTWGIAHRQLVWDWNHDAPEAETWMRGLLAPDPSVLRLSGKFPADPVYAPANPGARPALTPSTPPADSGARPALTPSTPPADSGARPLTRPPPR